MDAMKNSPANGPGTPRDDIPQNGNGPGPDMGYPNLGGYTDNVSTRVTSTAVLTHHSLSTFHRALNRTVSNA